MPVNLVNSNKVQQQQQQQHETFVLNNENSGSYRTVSIVVATEELSRRGHEWPFMPAA